MLNRILLFIVTVASLVWITYVGYDLINRRDNLSPRSIFGKEDGELLIINRPEEADLSQINVEIKHAGKAFLELLLSQPVQNERIYVSKKRNVFLVEMPNLWTRTGVKNYFKEKGLEVAFGKKKEFSLSNGMVGRYQQNFLVLSEKYVERQKHRLEWCTWDKKASVTILDMDQPMLSTDIYFKTDGTIAYQTKLSSEYKSRKIDDQELFAENLPGKLTNYHFYEKNFAVFSEVLPVNSPLYKWMDNGFALFDYNGVRCLISDYQNGQDPLLVLNEFYSPNSDAQLEEKQKIKNIQLLNSFPGSKSAGFYLMKVGDKVILSESLETCQQVVADYQLGKTLALSKELVQGIYSKLPRRVSERYITSSIAYTQSAYKDILVKTVYHNFSVQDQGTEPITEEKELSWTTPVEGQVEALIGRGNQQFVFTSGNQGLALSRRVRNAKLQIDGEIIGEPKLVDYKGTGQLFVLLNTSATIYLFDMKGNIQEGFPMKIQGELSSEVNFYRYKNQSYLIGIENNQKLVQWDESRKELRPVTVSAGKVINKVDVFVQNNNLIAVVSGDKATQTINLQKYKVVKNHPVLPQDRLSIKDNEGPKYYTFNDGHLAKYEYNGKSLVLGNYPNARKVKYIEGAFSYITFESYNKIHILNAQGVKMAQVDVPFKELSGYDVITLRNGKTYVAMIEGIENNLYLFDTKNNSMLKKPLEAREKVLLSEYGNGNLQITTVGNGFIIQYFDVLNQ